MVRRNISTQPLARRRPSAPAALIPFVIAFVALTSPAEAQETELRSQVRHWLETTCGVGDESVQPLSLRELGTGAVPLFIEAFDAGPDVGVIGEASAAAARRFARIEVLLGEGQSFGLSQADLETLKGTQRGEFIGQAVDDLIFKYGDAALRAVRIIDGSDSRRFLQRVAENDASPHAETARALLREMRG